MILVFHYNFFLNNELLNHLGTICHLISSISVKNILLDDKI